MDLFEQKQVNPMLIGVETAPFDDPNYIYELKLDGERCVAYLDPKSGTELRNKRNVKMLPKVPELTELHKYVKTKCVLDGELTCIGTDGKPVFHEIQRRSLMTNKLRIDLAAKQHPATFVAFDILYYKDRDIKSLPLMERKALLQKAVKEENARFAVSRYIEEQGAALFAAAKAQKLEGVVGKRKDSLYFEDKRTKDWKKVKFYHDDDFVICGYIFKENNMTSLVLGQYRNGELVYKGHVTMGISREDFKHIQAQPELDAPDFDFPAGHGNENAVWIEPELVCKVEFMERTQSGGMRQPRFKGLRLDKEPEDCVEKQE